MGANIRSVPHNFLSPTLSHGWPAFSHPPCTELEADNLSPGQKGVKKMTTP